MYVYPRAVTPCRCSPGSLGGRHQERNLKLPRQHQLADQSPASDFAGLVYPCFTVLACPSSLC
jgi:hypothetical protein